MKTSSAILQVGLTAASLGVAYATWQREPDRPSGEVVVVDFKKRGAHCSSFIPR